MEVLATIMRPTTMRPATTIIITEKILCIGIDAQDFVWFKKEILDKANSLL